jgi:hypothetical protein
MKSNEKSWRIRLRSIPLEKTGHRISTFNKLTKLGQKTVLKGSDYSAQHSESMGFCTLCIVRNSKY